MACLPWVRAPLRRTWYGLGEEEEFLLAAARAARGRLIFQLDPTSPSTLMLQLREFPLQRQLENLGQVEHLVAQGLVCLDKSGSPERYVLTPKGWSRAEKLPVLPMVAARQGPWYNSISPKPRRPKKR